MEQVLTISDIANVVKAILPHNSKVWLYGSRARGEARPDSDWDLLVLLDKDQISNEDFNRYGYPLIEMGWHHKEDLSPQLYTTKEWEEMRITPFYQNVEHDKKVVYES